MTTCRMGVSLLEKQPPYFSFGAVAQGFCTGRTTGKATRKKSSLVLPEGTDLIWNRVKNSLPEAVVISKGDLGGKKFRGFGSFDPSATAELSEA